MTILGTDFYSECEDALMRLVRAKLPTLFPHEWSVSNDDTVITKGGDYFLITRPGRFPYKQGSEMEDGNYEWEIRSDLFVRYSTYKTSWNKFKAVRSELIHLIHMYRNLDNTPGVLDVAIQSSERPSYFKLDETAVKAAFIIQTLEITAKQWVTFTGGEI